MKKLTGYLIDPFQRRFHEIETTDKLDDWHKLLDCEVIDLARVEQGIDIWIDDEGLMREPHYPLFSYLGFGNPLCGYGLALSSNGPESISLERPPGFFQTKIQFEDWENRLRQEDYFDQMSRVYPVRHIGKFGVGSTEVHVCSLCHKPYQGYGNNALPLNEGRCCDDCNRNFVIPARQLRMSKGQSAY